VGRPKGLRSREGDPIPWVVRVEGKKGFWVVECGEWTAKRARPPCGLIASARGWLVVDRKGTTSLWLGGTSFIRSQLVSPLKDKFYVMFSMLIFIVYIFDLNVVVLLN
jgi:hypothetical protein